MKHAHDSLEGAAGLGLQRLVRTSADADPGTNVEVTANLDEADILSAISAPPAAQVSTEGTFSAGDARDRTVTFSRTIDEDLQALALSPEQVPPNITLQVEAVRPDGSRTPMIRLNTRPDWDRRYWFERPLALPRGSKVEVIANLDDPDILSSAFSATSTPRAPAPVSIVRLALNVVPARAKPIAP